MELGGHSEHPRDSEDYLQLENLQSCMRMSAKEWRYLKTSTVDFKIDRQVLQKYVYSEHCPGCDAAFLGKRCGHTTMCKKKLEEAINVDTVDQDRIRRSGRMTGQRQMLKRAVAERRRITRRRP